VTTRRARWLAGLALLLVAGIALAIVRMDRSVDYYRGSADPRVRNGAAFDRATIDLAGAQELVVPSDAIVSRDDGEAVRVFLKKELGFMGHPPKPMDPLTARRAMGLATRRSDTSIECGTYGEWSGMEGGAHVAMRFVVPTNLKVSYSGDLLGSDSRAAPRDGLYWLSPGKESDPSWWYAADVPAAGWTAVPAKPDPSRQADRR
jgi:hypothetical protein